MTGEKKFGPKMCFKAFLSKFWENSRRVGVKKSVRSQVIAKIKKGGQKRPPPPLVGLRSSKWPKTTLKMAKIGQN